MIKHKYYLATGVLLCTTIAGTIASVPNSFAKTVYEDLATNTGFNLQENLFPCVLAEYKNVNNVDDEYLMSLDAAGEPLPAAGLANITNLTCTSPTTPGADKISGATGIENLPNLQSLNLSNNNLTSIDISNNKKLKEITLDNNMLTSLNVFNNVDLEKLFLAGNPIQDIDISNNLMIREFYIPDATVTTSRRAERAESGYSFDLTMLMWFSDNLSNWRVLPSDKYTYDPTTHIITVPEREYLADGFQVAYIEDGGYGDSTITISANPAAISVRANIGNISIKNIAQKYPNESWDSDDYLDTVSAKLVENGIEGVVLSKVEAYNYSSFYYDERPNVNVGISDGSTATHVRGTISANLAHPNVEIVYYYETPGTTNIKVPNTGLFTGSEKSFEANGNLLTLALIAIGLGGVVIIARHPKDCDES